ncbi:MULTISPECIES: HP1 family phage holin [Erwinia]|uniref:Conserved uncharacterized protein n=1 Tax=Erwinia billingiae (strain Eb661) TaxID=634500 RepID=D8MKI5_ERWBE|nr:HP1 family phage holin [Erwinia billingiae]CAX57641.1 conserved uncharacterized protein [Erwinia billingiae Eb661]
MGLNFDRVVSFLSYLPSAFLTTLGLFSLTQWATLIGIVLGILTYRLNKRHKRRVELEEEKRTAIMFSLAEKAGSHNLNEVVGAFQEMARTEKRGRAL